MNGNRLDALSRRDSGMLRRIGIDGEPMDAGKEPAVGVFTRQNLGINRPTCRGRLHIIVDRPFNSGERRRSLYRVSLSRRVGQDDEHCGDSCQWRNDRSPRKSAESAPDPRIASADWEAARRCVPSRRRQVAASGVSLVTICGPVEVEPAASPFRGRAGRSRQDPGRANGLRIVDARQGGRKQQRAGRSECFLGREWAGSAVRPDRTSDDPTGGASGAGSSSWRRRAPSRSRTR